VAFQFRGQPLDLGDVSIETANLRLRPISRSDAPAVFENFTPAITQYMFPKPATVIAETEAFIEEALVAQAQCTDLHLAICLRDDGEFLGICGLHGGEAPAQPELGIWLKQSAHGRRYGLEAISALRSWASMNIRCDFLVYPVDRRNMPSRLVAERLGGVLHAERSVRNMSGCLLDEVVYRIQPELVSGS
jgi:RimJ/RimL family protein N-acetyltransferase